MSFDPKALKARAMQATGLADFGEGPFEDGLEACCASLAAEAGLHEKGVAQAEGAIVASLSERLRVEDCLRQHPEILDQSLPPMIFVVGLPRTGTTALSQFLSEDPKARSIRRWECTTSTPPPDVNVKDDPRIAVTRQAFAARYAAMPALRTMLPVEAEDPSESGPILGLAFRSFHYPTQFNVPSYRDWLFKADMRPAYEYFAKVLKLLQWKTPAAWWNLKNPPDVFAMDAIAEVFPRATFLWTHRDPALSITSVASLAALLRTPTVDHLDKPALMQYIVRFQAEGIRRGLAARAKLGEGRFVDVTQAELARDTLGVIQDVYRRAGLAFTPEYESYLKQRMANRPRGQHGRHEYDRDEFAITPDEIRSHFIEYLARFDVVEQV
jgi:hypothetical protein